MARQNAPQLTLGIALLAVGGVLLATHFFAIDTAPAWLFGIGLGLTLIAILRRAYGALVGGMVLLGLGSGFVLGDYGTFGLRVGTWILLGLGAGFIGIYVLGVILKMNRHWWPLIPGFVLLATGGARYIRHFAFIPPEAAIFVRTWWPAALVLAGLFVIIRAVKK